MTVTLVAYLPKKLIMARTYLYGPEYAERRGLGWYDRFTVRCREDKVSATMYYSRETVKYFYERGILDRAYG